MESFNARLRDELLDGEILYTLKEARIVIEELAAPLQRRATACFSGLQAAGTGGVRACPCSVAVCAHSNRSDGHASAGAETVPKLTLQLDHSMGADQQLSELEMIVRRRPNLARPEESDLGS